MHLLHGCFDLSDVIGPIVGPKELAPIKNVKAHHIFSRHRPPKSRLLNGTESSCGTVHTLGNLLMIQYLLSDNLWSSAQVKWQNNARWFYDP